MTLRKLFARWRNAPSHKEAAREEQEAEAQEKAPEEALPPAVEQTAMRPPRSGYLAVCAIMKNESRNILEWIAYHRLMGVEQFFLYDNLSTDNTAELLAPLIEEGLVDYTYWPHKPGQVPAYNDCALRHREHWRWCAFIDLDEYISIADHASIPEWLDGYEDKAAVALHWLNYGPSGHESAPPGLIIDNYRYRVPAEFSAHQHVKTIVKMANFERAIGPHSFVVSGEVVNASRQPIVWMPHGDYGLQPTVTHEHACINHYYTRSREDWREKLARGRADTAIDDRLAIWFEIYLRHGTIRDDRLAHMVPGVAAEVARYRTMLAEDADGTAIA